MFTVEFQEAELKQAMEDLSYSDFKLWVAIKLRLMDNELNSPDWPCAITILQLEEDTGLCRAWVIECTRRLVEMGYLKRRKDPITRAYAYSEPAVLPFQKVKPVPRVRTRKRIHRGLAA